jgi:hypothetical protein
MPTSQNSPGNERLEQAVVLLHVSCGVPAHAGDSPRREEMEPGGDPFMIHFVCIYSVQYIYIYIMYDM